MKSITEKHQTFIKLPFPEKLAGKELLGIDLISLDTFTAGLIDKYITRNGNLSSSDSKLLDKLNIELKSVLKELDGIEKTYFSCLWSLVNQIDLELNND